MSKAGYFAALVFLLAPVCPAQTAPEAAHGKATVICLAELNGPEAKNWKLREPIERELIEKSSEKKMDTRVVLLDARDEKHGRSEAAAKSCEMQVYSTVDRIAKPFQVSMNPSSTGRESANPNRPVNASTVTYNFKVVNASGKKLLNDHADVDLLPEFTPADYNKAGMKLIDAVAEKILGAVPKE